jgi:phosphohistidine phosphatase
MWIYLLRHGIAEDHRPDRPDEDRELTDEGRKRLQRAGGTWKQLVHTPDVVMTSPLKRARQTADVFADAIGFDGDLHVDAGLVPGAMTTQAMTLLEGEMLAQTDSVVVIGHEPHLGYLLGMLLTGNPGLSIPLKKGMIVGVQTETPTSLIASLRFAIGQKAAAKLG